MKRRVVLGSVVKRFRRRLLDASARVVVRRVFTGRQVLLILSLLLVPLALIVWLLVQQGASETIALSALRRDVEQQRQALELLRTGRGVDVAVSRMETETQQQLLSRIRELEMENGRLREDLLFFERLSQGSDGGLARKGGGALAK